MKLVFQYLIVFGLTIPTLQAQTINLNIPYAESENDRQKLDIYAPDGAKQKPVVFWIHGGGWQAGSRTSVQDKPQAFHDKGFVFVSTGYRLLPDVDMETLTRDVAKSVGWVRKHIADYGEIPIEFLSWDTPPVLSSQRFSVPMIAT